MASGKLPVVAGSYVDENEPIVLIAESAHQAEEAQRQLVRIGLDRIIAWLPAIEVFDSASLATSAIRSISTAALKEDLVDHPEGRVLDVRSLDEFGESHVTGATHVAYTRLARHLNEVPRGKPLYVHCGSGVRAALAAAYLARQEFDVVHVDGAFSEIAPESRDTALQS
jgi:hydroxyacylglutathione hydrolase